MRRGHHHHPFRALRGLVGWTLLIAHLPDGVLGLTDHRRRTITIAEGLTQAERRCTLEHELHHVARGPVTRGWVRREERIVDELAARRLIPIERLADALLWSLDEHEVAEELWVDVATVRVRLATLGPDEASYIDVRLDDAGR